jgi:thiol:disulfide interchange protein
MIQIALMKRLMFPLLLLLSGGVIPLQGQILEPVKWSYDKIKIDDLHYELKFKASIEKTWYLYAQDIPAGGPVKTSFIFNDLKGIEFPDKSTIIEKEEVEEGVVEYRVIFKEPTPVEKFDPHFDMVLRFFSDEVEFTKKIRRTIQQSFQLTGYIYYMCCDDAKCLPPTEVEFAFDFPAMDPDRSTSTLFDEVDLGSDIIVDIEEGALEDKIAPFSGEDAIQKITGRGGLWYIFIFGFLGGLLALLTPCVFPMIPMTVSYFIRNTSNASKGKRDALIYGISIVVIYVSLGLGVSLLFGADGLNRLSTSPWFNIFFFLLLLVFAAAFFGAFELTLPSSWTTALDNKAEKTGGFLGVFLMALVLVLVSFSCTGPIIGTLLVEAAVSGNMLSPLVGMTGFSVALAIPFSLLAIFPSWLSSMPKSGGWLNSVKVVLAFLLLAFSLKFLSSADAVGQWGLMSREVFLAIWIAIFFLLGMYLLGKIRFAHDSDIPYVSVSRLFLVLASFSFAIYLIPGMWGAPLRAISSFAPPLTTQTFDLNRITMIGELTPLAESGHISSDYNTKEGVYGLIKFLDYEEGMEFARNAGKPVFLDFTGYGCANCRKMESSVWSDPGVLQRLRNDYVIISLYVDDRTRLAEEDQYVSDFGGRARRIRTVGNKWSDFQARRYGVNSQPYYILLGHDEIPLAEPYGYNSNVGQFLNFLNQGIDNFAEMSQVK